MQFTYPWIGQRYFLKCKKILRKNCLFNLTETYTVQNEMYLNLFENSLFYIFSEYFFPLLFFLLSDRSFVSPTLPPSLPPPLTSVMMMIYNKQQQLSSFHYTQTIWKNISSVLCLLETMFLGITSYSLIGDKFVVSTCITIFFLFIL